MASKGLCCGIIRGTFYAREAGTNAPLLPLGNAEAEITQEMTEITQPNFESLGGDACSVEYPESVNIALTLHCTKPENLALAFLGQATQLAGADVVGETHPVYAEDSLIEFLHLPDQTKPIVVKSGSTTYVKDTDYAVTNAGIKIIEGTSIPLTGANITVDYTYGANWVVDAQTVGQKTMYIVLDGMNYGGESAKPVKLQAWRVKLAPTESFAIISGTEFASLVLNGKILKDDSKSVGSQFFKLEYASKAQGAY